MHDLREIVNAILYVNRTGVPWEYLPHGFPPYKTVYVYWAKWEADGTTRQVHGLLRDKTRQLHGRSVQSTAAVVDAQSVKTSTNVSEASQGIDAGKKIRGRRRHVIADTLGLVLAVLVTAANVHDTSRRGPGPRPAGGRLGPNPGRQQTDLPLARVLPQLSGRRR
ncbi:transposase [Streptomyces sp. ME02-6987-2C]|uniref:transposase n=1 Tax=Streptomyces sp. ME02-6985-2c TaxID=3028675 RepID=UPI0029B47CEA|nr:transposase [Streptomyces sp. ME02-6987-2C]MDX3427074.1 transposase [Streptomyces sp. ME02-6985-2c]